MLTTITIIVLITLAVSLKGASTLSQTLLAPIASVIQAIGSLTEEAKDKLKRFITQPSLLTPTGFLMRFFFFAGALAWILIDSYLLSFGLQLVMPGNVSALVTTGIRPIDSFFSRYFFLTASISITILSSLLLHYFLQYLQETFPQSIGAIIAIAVLLTVLGLIITLALLSHSRTTLSHELVKSIASGEFNYPDLIRKSATFSSILFVLGTIASGLCIYLSLSPLIYQLSQLSALLLLYLPLSLLWIALIIAKKLLDSSREIIAIPFLIIDSLLKFFKRFFNQNSKVNKPTGFLTAILIFFLCISGQGCIPESKNRLIVVIFDNSGSFEQERKEALQRLYEVIETIEIGDEFYSLLITQNSFSDKRLQFLQSDYETGIESKMQFFKHKQELKSKLAATINSSKTAKTDLIGALERAQIIFSSKEDSRFRKLLVIFSDLSHNTANKLSTLSLAQVDVLVLFVSSDKESYESSQKQIEKWKQIFKQAKASSVQILTHDLSVTYNIKSFIK
ncbi:MAG: vWA domain-containing protein [Candidatus Edwardsbacteria bacterium]